MQCKRKYQIQDFWIRSGPQPDDFKTSRTWQKFHYREMPTAKVNTTQNRRPEPAQKPASATDYIRLPLRLRILHEVLL